MEKLLKFIKEKYPENTIDISESIELLIDTIDNLRKEIKNIQEKIEEVMEKLSIDEEKIEEVKEENKKDIPNYSDYKVDNNIEHNLYEDFTYKKPFGFKLNENRVIKVSSWKELLVKTCEILISINENKFISFESNDAMKGKKRKVFSSDPNELRVPRKIGDKIYIETNQSANFIRDLIKKLLKEYNFKTIEYKVYLKADYTNLNK
ncbi:hypothetical protein EV215_0653 [Hypnocyclicus thermotrophus]|uniref:Uncharacterized protein n=1 Tax=Hypnocyclicus thermotrophus TaxID=1627895 RepID=A0AA46DZW3_9FUSO|nr:hypothetical protein [Hypnocyclicus thermotrophus]TDT71960.1 hypothetical protein EV215_0653 [Hypnocyclicus thermotrophus]